ncbi:MAG TPA: TonB-dependent receptor [Candidatus Acidoferrales bacterium]|nr:TonB-dependent receptor [Candidatus Acidoferrales bacterium]
MKTKLAVWVSLLALVIFAGGKATFGQAATSLRGSVTDPSGAAIPNATIQLINTGTNATRTAYTDAQGAYDFLQVVPGTYRLEVQAKGFSKYVQNSIQLLVNLPATVNVKMRLGTQSQTVTVTEAAPVLNTTDASEGNTMGQLQIEQLPIEARDIVQLLSLEPGVVYTSDRTDIDTNFDTRSGAVNGERSDQSNVTLDGVDDNQQTSGEAFSSVLPVPIESVQEFRVTTSNYGADQGRSSGAQVALVTKPGTNKFHGSAYEFNRSGLGEANDYFIKSSELSNNEPNVPPHLVRNVFGGDVGGPVIKDRLFFFLNYEGHRQSQGDSADRIVPSSSLRDGVIMYLCDQGGTGAPLDSRCLNPTPVQGQSGKSYTVPSGYFALGPTQLTSMDPLGSAGGPDPASLAYFNSYPVPNDPSKGDTVNYIGYRFAAPSTQDFKWLVGRVDYKLTSNGNHTLFWRGSGRDDITSGDPFLPGTPPETTTLDRSKGFVLGYTALLRSNLVNNFHYGLTRQSIGNTGDSNQPWIYVRGLDQGITYGSSFVLPVHDFVDDLNWTKGNHSLNFGTDIRLIRSSSQNQNLSYSYATANSEWLDVGGFANKNSPFNPACNAQFTGSGSNCASSDIFPAVDPSFVTSYDWPLIGMLGMVSEVDAQYNYHLNPDGTGTPLNQGASVVRNFSTDEFDFYAQDSWKIRPNFTFNFGLRYELMTPVTETSGQEVMPVDASGQPLPLGTWFNQRAQNALQGLPSNLSPNIYFGLAGSTHNKPGYYSSQTKNFAPRISFAWSPDSEGGLLHRLFGDAGKSVIRAGAGMYYDHFGYALVQNFDQNGAFGLATNLGNQAQVESACSSPRLTSFNSIPENDLGCAATGTPPQQIYLSAPAAQFPEEFPEDNFCICWGIDNNLKTPYSYALDFSYERELTHSMSLEIAYVGHLGHRLLVQDDLASPMNLVDPATKIDYFSAAKALAKVYEVTNPPASSSVTAAMVGPTAAYWSDMIQPLQPGGAYSLYCSGGSTPSVVQAVYDIYSCYALNETSALDVLDQGGIPDANLSGVTYTPVGGLYSYFQNQFSSLYAWRTMAPSWYHGLQVTLKQDFSHGLLFNFNYTYSHSTDLASDAERIGPWGGLGGWITNAWDPNQSRGPSDFDLRHQVNANWVWQLPVGHGRAFGHDVGNAADALIGGWQLSGVARWSSGFPVTVDNGGFYPTDWQLEGHANLTGSPIATGKSLVGGYVNMFPNPNNGANSAYAGFRFDLPGESGVRNPIRGDGYAGLDLGLAKTWKMPYNENHSLEFSWNVFNVPNLTRFDVQTASLILDTASDFGRYGNLLTNPRIMQFGLMYSF